MLIIAFSPGPFEIIVVVVLLIVLFGKRLPEVGKSLGKGFVEFKKGVKGIENEVKVDVDGAVDDQMAKDREKSSETVFCSNCGHKNEKSAVFCSSCGQRIGTI